MVPWSTIGVGDAFAIQQRGYALDEHMFFYEEVENSPYDSDFSGRTGHKHNMIGTEILAHSLV